MVIPLIRQVVLGTTTAFSIVVLAVSAQLTSQTLLLHYDYYNVTAPFRLLAIAVGAISLWTLPVMMIVDIFRRGAFTSMIVVELVWLSVLSALWIGSAGESVYIIDLILPNGCVTAYPIVNGMCQEGLVIVALSFINFIILLLYTGLLLIMGIIAASRGQNVWLSSVRESFGRAAVPVEQPMGQLYHASVPPQPQAQVYGQSVVGPTGPIQPGATLGRSAIGV